MSQFFFISQINSIYYWDEEKKILPFLKYILKTFKISY